VVLRVRQRRRKLLQFGAVASAALFAIGVAANFTGLLDWMAPDASAGVVSDKLTALEQQITRLETAVTPGEQQFADQQLLRDATRKLSHAGLPVDSLVEAVVNTGNIEDARAALTADLNASAGTGAVTQRIQKLHQLGAITIERDPTSALTIYREILDLNAQDFEAHERMGVAKYMKLDMAGARQHFEFIIKNARPDSYAHTEGMLRRASVYRINDQFDEAADLYLRVMLISENNGYDDLTSRAASLLSDVEYLRENFQSARKIAEEILPFQKSHGFEDDLTDTLLVLIDLDFRDGRFAEARVKAEQCLKLQQDLHSTFGIIFALDHVGQIDIAQGRTEEARSKAHEMQSLARAQNMTIAIWRGALLLAETEKAEGRSKEACAALRAAEKYRNVPEYAPSPRIKLRLAALDCVETQ
jgi:tetratricopeptide (TPR) repeat protein